MGYARISSYVKPSGDSIYEGFVEAKTIEWTEYRKQVHAWEIERYLRVF